MNRRILPILILVATAWLIRTALDHGVVAPPYVHLHTLPVSVGDWISQGELPIDDESRKVLRADDLLARSYQGAAGARVQLFIAYYRVQRAGEMMHSPRNCLPGSGWDPLSLSVIPVGLGRGQGAMIDRYLVERDGRRLLILYWYQENGRVISNEWQSKAVLMWDAIRLHRRDGALVRVSMPLSPGENENVATEQMLQFVSAAGPHLTGILGGS